MNKTKSNTTNNSTDGLEELVNKFWGDKNTRIMIIVAGKNTSFV